MFGLPWGSDEPGYYGKLGRSAYTAQKLADLDGILHIIRDAVVGIRARNHWATALGFVAIDGTSGPGRTRDALWYRGTPLRCIEAFGLRFDDARYYFVEAYAPFARDLEQVVAEAPSWLNKNRITVEHGNWETLIPEWLGSVTTEPYGVLILDENGEPNWSAIAALFRTQPQINRVDLILSCPAAITKRATKAYQREVTLRKSLATIPKKHWLARETLGSAQWTWIIGTNWADFPAWSARGFERLDLLNGTPLLDTLDLTRAERAARDAERRRELQPALPFLSGVSAPSALQSGAPPGDAARELALSSVQRGGDASTSPALSAVGDVRRD